MARELSWKDVRGGLIAVLVLVVAALAILRFARVGALRGETFRAFAIVGEARGVAPGSEVWLSGQKVGKITRVDFRSPAIADTGSRLLLELEILSANREIIHRDATAQIRAGGSVIGAAVLYLSPGTPRTVALRDGDTLRTRPQDDFEAATAQFGLASREFPVIINNVKVLAGQLGTTQGTAGAFMNGPGLGQMEQVQIRAGRMVNRLKGQGTVGLVMRGGLASRADGVMARVDSVRALLASPATSLGRFRRDSTLMDNVADIRRELNEVQRLLDEPRGTAGRVAKDSAIVNALAVAQREMALLFADIKKRPFRYITF